MTIKRLGVVMAVVNCLTYSKQTFQSVVFPPGVDCRWLVIDQASADYSYMYFRDCDTPERPVEVRRHQRNVGVSRAWNIGIRWAWEHGCDAVLITGNDVVYHPQTVTNLCRWIDAGECFVTVAPVGEDPAILATVRLDPTWMPYPAFSGFVLTPEVTAHNVWFDESLAIPDYFNDNVFHEDMIAAGLPAGHVLDAPVTHYGSRTINEGGVRVGNAFDVNRQIFVSRYGYDPSALEPRAKWLPTVPKNRVLAP